MYEPVDIATPHRANPGIAVKPLLDARRSVRLRPSQSGEAPCPMGWPFTPI